MHSSPRPRRGGAVTNVIGDAPSRARRHLHTLLRELLSWDVKLYNDGNELGRAVFLAVQVQAYTMVAGWPTMGCSPS